MSTYKFLNQDFLIEDYQNAKTFSSFLPAIAGIKGKPLWAFYANVGQCMGGFGVHSKETPLTPFDSATLAYQNIPLKSFRSFVKVLDKNYAPFFKKKKNQVMKISKTSFLIKEDNEEFSYEVSYTSLPNRPYAGLIRKVTITNHLDREEEFRILDGLPIFFPRGLSNYCYKELVSLMSAYCEVFDKENFTPFIKFKTSTADHSEVSMTFSGNGFMSIDEDNHKLYPFVDLESIFANDTALLEPLNFFHLDEKEFLSFKEQVENKLPCAFSYVKKKIKAHESYSFISLYGMFESREIFHEAMSKEDYVSLNKTFKENETLIEELLSPLEVKTSNDLFDQYAKQCFLDNNLRGGFPLELIKDKEVYYVYSRKHGDMERDYNSFEIPSTYYSSGGGNFRDVNQNRRSDLYFYPFVKDYNIHLFFSLIGLDGQNPLSVLPPRFKINKEDDFDFLAKYPSIIKETIFNYQDGFTPSNIYTLLKDHESEIKENIDDVFKEILKHSHQEIYASFNEGYWVDHWTYNVDLLENYYSVYPDFMNELLLKEYAYFDSKVEVRPRKDKYVFNSKHEVRQYEALSLPKDKTSTSWAKDQKGNECKSTLISKICSLILIKFATLDPLQIGIEMECEKPGWNDALNGLPGLIGSGISESIELIRLIRFTLKVLPSLNIDSLDFYEEQKELFDEVNMYLKEKEEGKLTAFHYWDKVATSREKYRNQVYHHLSGHKVNITKAYMISSLKAYEKVLTQGILKAKEMGKGIILSYLYYEMNDYEVLDEVNILKQKIIKPRSFIVHEVPYFLEGPARALKLGKEFTSLKDYKAIKESDLYDKKLKIYKTCVSLDHAPFEIGRIHAFTKGWLERECNFLHMSFKYILGLLSAGYYKEFYLEMKNNFPCFMDPSIYGRNPLENSSFIVPSCNPNEKIHGQGFFARLTGANAEFLQMLCYLFVGKNIFRYENNKLKFTLEPKLSKEFFKDDRVSFKLFSSLTITYHNIDHIDTFDDVHLTYIIHGKRMNEVSEQDAYDIRNGKITSLDVEIRK